MTFNTICSITRITNAFCSNTGINHLEGAEAHLVAATTAVATGALLYYGGYRAINRAAHWVGNTIQHYGTLLAYRNGPIATSFRFLREAHLLTPENSAAVVANGGWGEELSLLSQARPNSLVTQPNFDMLVSSWVGQGPFAVVKGLRILSRALPNSLVTQANFNGLILSRGGFAGDPVATGLLLLSQARPNSLVTQENFDALVASGGLLWEVANGLLLLSQALPNSLLTPANRAALVLSGSARDVAEGLRLLSQALPHSLVTQENFDALVASGRHAGDVADGLRILSRAHPNSRVTQGNFDALVRRIVFRLLTPEDHAALVLSGGHAQAVALGVLLLSQARPNSLVTQENFAALFASGGGARRVALGLRILGELPNSLLTPANRAALVVSGRHAGDVADGLRILSQAFPNSLVTQENFDLLVANGRHAREIVRLLRLLDEADLLIPDNIRMLLDIFSDIHPSEQHIHIGEDFPSPLTQKAFDDFRENVYAWRFHPAGPRAEALITRAYEGYTKLCALEYRPDGPAVQVTASAAPIADTALQVTASAAPIADTALQVTASAAPIADTEETPAFLRNRGKKRPRPED